jgi:hypothetical protein
MKSFDGESGVALRLDALAELARVARPPMTPLQRMGGLQLVNARVATRQRRRLSPVLLSLLGGTVAVTGAVLLVNMSTGVNSSSNAAMTYRIEGGEVGDGGYIRSSDPAGSLVRFGEGSELRLMTGARGRLTSVDAQGARFAIEEGVAEVSVVPRPGARWLVDAGPFLITVRGTIFTASWDGATERFDVLMKKGLVSVTGPLANGVLSVRAGQHLSINIHKKEVLLREIEGSEGHAADVGAGVGEPVAETSGGSNHSSATAWGSRRPPSRAFRKIAAGRSGTRILEETLVQGSGILDSRGWHAALASGSLDSILADAERLGLQRALSETTGEDLAALADAARYRRRDDVARQAYSAQRERFPSSSRAHDSAFLLGRLEEARPNGGFRALQWYDLYLREAPSGAYSSEALGRKMTATERMRGVPAARDVANDYLRRFPKGTYAGAARALLAAP